MREKFAENTKRDTAEANLRRSEERFRLLVETMPEAYAELDVEGRWTYVNKQMGELLGLDPADAIGRSPEEFLDEENRQILADEMARRDSTSPRQHEISWTKVSGEIVHGLVSPQPLFDGEGRFRGSFAIITDITARKKAEKRLADINAALELRVEGRTAELDETQRIAGLGSWEWDLKTGEVHWSKEVARIHGYGEEARGAHGKYDAALDGVHPDDRDRVHDRVHRAVSDGEGFSIDYRIVLRSGAIRHVHEQGVVVHDSEGKPLRITGTIQDITERKAIENALREGESRLAEAQRIAHLGSWDWNIVTDSLVWSDEIYRIFGLRPQQFGATYEAFLEIVHPDDRDYVKESVDRALEGEPYSIDHRIVLPDGEVRFVHEEGEIAFNDRDDPVRMQGVIQDFTERKLVEDALRLSESRLAEAQRQAQLGYWSWDIESNTLTWSDEIYRIIGRIPGEIELTREAFQEVVHPEDREFVDRYVRQAAAGGKTHPIDYRIILPSGEVRCVAGYSELVCDAEGRPVQMTGTFQDITDRKRVEGALHESEASLAAAQRIAHVGSWDWDIQKDKFSLSEEMIRIIGLSSEYGDMNFEIGMTYIHPEDRTRIEAYVRDALEGKASGSMEYRILRDSGESRFAHLESEVSFDSKGTPIRMRGTVQDITERKAAEDELARYRERLEELVEERTVALEGVQEELVRKERLAVLGQLTGTVSHELRNPLGTIRNSLYSINEMFSESQKDAGPILERANRGIDRCDRIIDELLEYTRTRRFEFLSTDIDAWMGSLISEYEFPPEVQVELSFQSGEKVAIDSDRLYRCVINLFANAVQAIGGLRDAGAPKKLSIRTATDGTSVTIEVADSGSGIDPENMEKIFEPLFSTKGFGVGLGLCIVKQTVEGHGGAVTVRSEPDGGTVFTISIPIENFPVPQG